VGSLTGDPIGARRYIEIEEGNSCTAASAVIIYLDGRRFNVGSPQNSGFKFDWAGGLKELAGTTTSTELARRCISCL
jgi:hypothetical protein